MSWSINIKRRYELSRIPTPSDSTDDIPRIAPAMQRQQVTWRLGYVEDDEWMLRLVRVIKRWGIGWMRRTSETARAVGMSPESDRHGRSNYR